MFCKAGTLRFFRRSCGKTLAYRGSPESFVGAEPGEGG